MDYKFAYQLSAGELNDFESFYHSLESVTLEQYPRWTELEKGNFTYCFFIASENGKIVCAAVITERKAKIFRFARIQFGPIFKDPDQLIESLDVIERHYRSRSYVYLEVQLAFPTGSVADYIEYGINKIKKVNYRFDRENWSSIALDLQKPEEDIRRNFTKGHKSDVKKSEKVATVTALSTAAELDDFCRIFIKMNRERKLPVDEQWTTGYFKAVHNFLQQSGKGRFLIVREETGNVVGGIIVLFQGNTVRYFKGTSDSDYRHIPVLHGAIWEAIRQARESGFRYFDFWGYNHFADENDQVFYINRFKKGFGGEFLFYPKKMYFVYNPFMYRLYRQLLKIQQWMKKRR